MIPKRKIRFLFPFFQILIIIRDLLIFTIRTTLYKRLLHFNRMIHQLSKINNSISLVNQKHLFLRLIFINRQNIFCAIVLNIHSSLIFLSTTVTNLSNLTLKLLNHSKNSIFSQRLKPDFG